MGHQLLGPPPRSTLWKRTVGLISGGASAAQVANAAAAAAEAGLQKAATDHGVIEAMWLLMRLPLAAKDDDFAVALRGCGLDVPDAPDLLSILAAVADGIDRSMPANRGRTDLGEMAQQAVQETLTTVIGGRLATNLFETNPDDVRAEFARLGTARQFGSFAKDFFARFVSKCLTFHLARILPDHVGAGKRFTSLDQAATFRRDIDFYCREAAVIVETYSGQWFDKERFFSGGEVSREAVQRFVGYGMKKLTDELRMRNHTHGS